MTDTLHTAAAVPNLADIAALALTPADKRLLYLLAAIQFFNIVDFMMMMPLGPMLSRTMGIDTSQFAVLISSYTFAGAASGFVFALFADRFERKRLLLIIFALFLASTLACAAAPNYYSLLAARALAGIFGGVLGAMVNTIVADAIPPQRRGQAMGIVSMAFSASTVIGVPTALWLANHISWQPIAGWRAPFVAITVCASMLAIAIVKILPLGKQPKPAQAGELSEAIQRMRAVLADRNHQLALLLSVVIMLSSFTVIPYLTIYATRNAGFPESLLWLMYLLGGVLTLFTSRRIGLWADRKGKLLVFRVMVVLSAIPMLAITHVGEVPPAVYLCITSLFFVMINGRVIPGQALIAGAAYNTMRGTFMGLNACAMSLGLGIASYVGGHIISESATGAIVHFNWAGYVAVSASLCAFLLSGQLRQRA